MNKKVVITIFIISVLLIAGCGKKECETKTDCKSKGSCYLATCVKGTCEYKRDQECTCGDGACNPKAGENPCNCLEDCRPPLYERCEGNVGDYLEKRCDEREECVTSVREGVQKSRKEDDKIMVEETRKTVVELSATYSYDKPFDTDSSMFKIESLRMDKIVDTISDLSIKRIKITEHTGTYDSRNKAWKDDQVNKLFERDYNRRIWNEETIFSDSFPIVIDEEINETLMKSLWISIEFEYTVRDTRGNEKTSTYEHNKELDFELVNPTEERKCPERSGWDDGNPCTQDSCSETTDYFVEHIMRARCTGNFICETGENSCTPGAEVDCGPCEGEVGQYLEKICYNRECKTKLKEGIQVSGEIVPETKALQEITFNVKTGFNKPFNVKKDSFTITFELLKKGDAQDISITDVRIIDGLFRTSSLISEQKINKKFVAVGSSHTAVLNPSQNQLTSVQGEQLKKPILKVFYNYDVSRGDYVNEVISDYEQSLGDLLFINPEVEV